MRLAALGGELQSWFHKRNNPVPDRAIDILSPSELDRILEAGVQYADQPRRPLPELGYSVDLWNGDTKCPVTTSAGFNITSPFLTNSVNVVFDSRRGNVVDLNVLLDVLRNLVTCWNPDEGSIYQSIYRAGDFVDVVCAVYGRKPPGTPGKFEAKSFEDGPIWVNESAYASYL